MKFNTHNGIVICKKITSGSEPEVIGGIAIKKRLLPIYEIISVDNPSSSSLKLEIGDIVVCCNEGTSFAIENERNKFTNDVYYMFKHEHIIGRVEN